MMYVASTLPFSIEISVEDVFVAASESAGAVVGGGATPAGVTRTAYMENEEVEPSTTPSLDFTAVSRFIPTNSFKVRKGTAVVWAFTGYLLTWWIRLSLPCECSYNENHPTKSKCVRTSSYRYSASRQPIQNFDSSMEEPWKERFIGSFKKINVT